MSITFVLLGISILAVWLPAIRIQQKDYRVWPLLLAATLASGFIFGFLNAFAIIVLLLFAAFACSTADASMRHWRSHLALGMTVVLALAITMHAVPGFNNPIIADGIRFSTLSAPFRQYLNIDKAAVGLLLLAFLCRRSRSRAEWKDTIILTLPIAAVTVIIVLVAGYQFGYVRPDVKVPAYTPIFLATNLLFTCVAEEAFFRGLLQERMQKKLADVRHGTLIAVLISAVLFGLVHAGGGVKFVILSTLVGLGSAFAYARTRRIEAPIITHFSLNAIHFIFFSYPFLA